MWIPISVAVDSRFAETSVLILIVVIGNCEVSFKMHHELLVAVVILLGSVQWSCSQSPSMQGKAAPPPSSGLPACILTLFTNKLCDTVLSFAVVQRNHTCDFESLPSCGWTVNNVIDDQGVSGISTSQLRPTGGPLADASGNQTGSYNNSLP